jgi:class 3 adenylate cyclase
VVTFLFTDVEGSTRRWETDAQAMQAALAVHDKVLRTAIEAHSGFLFKHTGDSVCAVFASPTADLCAILDRMDRTDEFQVLGIAGPTPMIEIGQRDRPEFRPHH